jgi:hypothetical protein
MELLNNSIAKAVPLATNPHIGSTQFLLDNCQSEASQQLHHDRNRALLFHYTILLLSDRSRLTRRYHSNAGFSMDV